ncbi:MAG TPA: amidase [Candidatus Limnocylindrales bacterium]|nr:amidase [Candidatus Limnocylindrales bacterium]
MLDVPFRSAKELAAAIRRKKIGCLELLDLYLARVATHNPKLNAIIATDPAGARKRARAADRALAKGKPWGPLHGVPMTIKESYDVAGMPTTWGVPELKNNHPEQNALAVDRMLGAGVVLFGKTNVPLYLADYQSYNEIYGTTNNPWDVTRSPGGSSGGSAAALAAGLTGIEAGSDIGSSIRNPAHYCGVFGHKPTYGIVPPRGQALPGRVSQADISVIGPMARSADDLAIALDAMAGADEIDAAGWRLRLPAPRRKALREYRVAVMLDDPSAEVDAEVQARLQALADFLARKKVKMSDRARPAIDTREAHRVYIQLLRAATSGRQTAEEFARNQEVVRGLAPDDESYYAQMTRANTMPHRDWLAANEARHKMRLAWAEFFEEWDLLLCPVASSAAFPHDQVGERYERTIVVNGKRVPTVDQLFWAGYSGAFFLPAAVAPAGLTPGGLPVGVQIVGPQYGDRTCIAFAGHLEREFQAFVPPPGFD